MKIGLIARADSTGLGIQSKEFYDHINCEKVLVVDSSEMPGAVPDIHAMDLSKYRNPLVYTLTTSNPIGHMPYELIMQFIEGLDVVFAMETPYDYNIFRLCRLSGVKTILQLNYEFLDFPSGLALPQPDLFAAPSKWHYDEIPDPKEYLPVPVSTESMTPQNYFKRFVHVVGRPAMEDRNGTQLLMRALQFVKSEVTITITSQQPVPVLIVPPLNVTLVTDFGNKQDYRDNYKDGGTLILPRKFGGLSLPINEALGHDMPVIAPDISPNNQWLPSEWLVPASQRGIIHSKRIVEYYETSALALAEKIDQFCNEDFYKTAVEKARAIKHEISWASMIEKYTQIFASL